MSPPCTARKGAGWRRDAARCGTVAGTGSRPPGRCDRPWRFQRRHVGVAAAVTQRLRWMLIYIYILCSGAGYKNLARAANEVEKQVDVSSREGRNEEAVTDDDDDDGDTNAGHGGGETRV